MKDSPTSTPLDPAAPPNQEIARCTLPLYREDGRSAELMATHEGLKQ
jgi:hypothetical protein